eukprot:SAG22_NODE_2233_length_2809_cov_7.105166_2_plen_55_part_00
MRKYRVPEEESVMSNVVFDPETGAIGYKDMGTKDGKNQVPTDFLSNHKFRIENP